MHRIGGATVDNLRLKPREAALEQPGISVLKADGPGQAAQQLRSAFPRAKGLHGAAARFGSTSEDRIRSAGFDIMHVPSDTLPNHHRIIHPKGAAGFDDSNLEMLAQDFVNTTGH